MRIHAAISAHPARREMALDVQRDLDREAPIVFDENPKPSTDPLQRWATIRRAWEAAYDVASEETDAVLVLQDDARVCRDLVAGMEVALDHFEPSESSGRPEFLISPYTGRGRPNQQAVRRTLKIAELRGSSWASTRSLNWGVAICAPAWTVPPMIQAVDAHVRANQAPRSNTDYAIGVYYRDVLGWRTHYTVPSLVDHRRVPSLVGHDRGPLRVAHNFLGRGASALDVDWGQLPREGLRAPFAR